MDAKQDINHGPVRTLVTDCSDNSVSYIMSSVIFVYLTEK